MTEQGSERGRVDTTSGPVRGTEDRGVWAFKGVPYGADTSGSSRFRPPRPPQPWTAVRDCSAYGPSCPQVAGDLAALLTPELEALVGVLGYERVTDEDCLSLNVWTTNLDASARRPVLVWLHGGGWTMGSASWPLYEFDNLARNHDVVMVGVNHRLGILGFLDLSELDDDHADSGCVGMLDVVAALEWVRDNIAVFGGDPGNVTVFGESGGGAKTSALMAMPAAEGLFHQTFVMSGTLLEAQTPERAAAHTAVVLEHLADAKTAAALEALDVERLLDVERALAPDSARVPFQRGFGYSPVLCPALPRHPVAAIRDGAARDVRAVIGCTTDEMLSFLGGTPDFWTLDRNRLVELLAPSLGDDTDRIVRAYEAARPGESPTSVLIAIATDRAMRVPHIRLAEAKEAGGGPLAHMYLFAWGAPGPDGRVRSGHGSDMPYCFDNLDKAPAAAGPHAAALVNAMSTALVSLAATGDPNHVGIPDWPGYTSAARATLRIDVESTIELDPRGAERQAWDTTELAGLSS